ncbi:potassium channel protein [Nitratifractor salsuginis]|uniref:BK channel n=1 Tax=Nitratifractor salsuginis (strain DSM 16511 / JCM 12458 / E9I37-1) TaxID=749222 RepID=E6X1W7_NITSE|nr:potassium channel protein [Nitratifractor salsuginis]ADV45975.1 TrkA-N domain protein [Nitratifractor salsuginis DSM 16511]
MKLGFLKQLEERILRWAITLHRSQRYQRWRKKVTDLLENEHNPYKKTFDGFIIFLIFSSVFILIYEVKHPVPVWLDYYDIYFVSLVFLIEYILRLWISSDLTGDLVHEYEQATIVGREYKLWPALARALKKKLAYMVTPAAIVDLLAILPAYRPLRVLRIFVLFRFLKLLRYTRSINQFVEVLATKRFELLTLLGLLFFVTFTGAIAIYVLEDTHNPNINNIFDAIYWSLVTITTVGYGDIAPVSDMGRVIAMIIILFGIAMISFATSVIVSAFSEKLEELKEERIVEEVNRSDSFLIICGYGQMTKMFFRQSEAKQYRYIILDRDPARVQEALHDGYDAIVDDASRHATLSRFNIKGADVTVLCMSHDDVENIYITLNAKSIDPRIRVIARASSPKIVSKYERAGADHVLLPNQVAGTMMVTAILKPVMYRAIHAIFTGQNVALLDEVKIHSHSNLIGATLGSIDFKTYKLVLIGVHKAKEERFIFNPEDSVILEEGDVLLVMGHKANIAYFLERSCTEGKRCLS